VTPLREAIERVRRAVERETSFSASDHELILAAAEEAEKLRAAIDVLLKAKGRHNTALAYEALRAARTGEKQC
jgi:hypothetical protein